ncbi:MAG TPA: F0F1 ATP synthase subunit gamma [Membranihabitans sp.]|nr:F0F1 ATP synthase subunit gamma [Membranihabitans sp.]
MTDTLVNLQRRKQSAGDLNAVVRTMKAMAMSNITQYQVAVESLQEYYRTISLGIYACFKEGRVTLVSENRPREDTVSVAVIFGSDQGLVGRFNDLIHMNALQILKGIPGQKEVWAVGERVFSLLLDDDLPPTKYFSVPHSVSAITPLVNQILINSEQYRAGEPDYNFYIFHNKPTEGASYEQEGQQLFPPNKKWEAEITQMKWPNQKIPQVIGGVERTLRTLIREYLFVSLYKASAESLAAENASRLEAMERAEENIEEVLDELNRDYNRLRQSTIDGELFDVIAGFEALRKRDQ